MSATRPCIVARAIVLAAAATLPAAPSRAQTPATPASGRPGVHAVPPRALQAKRATSIIIVDGRLSEQSRAPDVFPRQQPNCNVIGSC